MATMIEYGFGVRRGLPDCRPTTPCETRPVCPACGGLECLCRPRFFAGQLLSEEDLNRLDHYLVAKNRLHNRHLFGTGVVCGLEVVCSVCDPAGTSDVVVKSGYALSPCGNDIVVCNQTSVNVCDLINRCRPKDDCIQPAPPPATTTPGDEEWVLAICYQEKPSRGVTAMRGASCGCGCGGSGGGGGGGAGGCGCGGGGGSHAHGEGDCGCGCGGKTGKSTRTRAAAKPGGTPALCEPTLTCESYGFAVYKLPPPEKRPPDPGALIRRFICCYQPLIEQLKLLPTNTAPAGEMHDWLTDHVNVVKDFLITEGLYDCDLAARLGAVVVPTPTGGRAGYLVRWNASAVAVLAILATVFQKCLCAALLPPCPPPEMNDCVPIATLQVARGTCRVRRVCNVDNRKFLLTWPAMHYWLSWLPMFNSWSNTGQTRDPTLRERLTALCCPPVSRTFDFNLADLQARILTPLAGGAGGATPRGMKAKVADGATASIHPFAGLLEESTLGAPQANAASLLLAAMGARKKDGTELVSEAALQFPGEAMLLHQVVGPVLAPLMSLAGAGAPTAGIESLVKTVADLKKTVVRQEKAIKQLKKRDR